MKVRTLAAILLITLYSARAGAKGQSIAELQPYFQKSFTPSTTSSFLITAKSPDEPLFYRAIVHIQPLSNQRGWSALSGMLFVSTPVDSYIEINWKALDQNRYEIKVESAAEIILDHSMGASVFGPLVIIGTFPNANYSKKAIVELKKQSFSLVKDSSGHDSTKPWSGMRGVLGETLAVLAIPKGSIQIGSTWNDQVTSPIGLEGIERTLKVVGLYQIGDRPFALISSAVNAPSILHLLAVRVDGLHLYDLKNQLLVFSRIHVTLNDPRDARIGTEGDFIHWLERIGNVNYDIVQEPPLNDNLLLARKIVDFTKAWQNRSWDTLTKTFEQSSKCQGDQVKAVLKAMMDDGITLNGESAPRGAFIASHQSGAHISLPINVPPDRGDQLEMLLTKHDRDYHITNFSFSNSGPPQCKKYEISESTCATITCNKGRLAD